MCLQLFVVPAIAGRVSPDRLSKTSGLRVKKLNTPVKGALGFSVDGGCSCSLMSEHADREAEVWKLEPSVLEGLALSVELVAKEAEGLAFHAYWAGDEPSSKALVRVAELTSDIRSNRVKNRHVYLVGKAV